MNKLDIEEFEAVEMGVGIHSTVGSLDLKIEKLAKKINEIIELINKYDKFY